jgi:N-acetylmuramic acid 6-phosphate etherase
MTKSPPITDFDKLVSEGRNPRTMDIDLLPTRELLCRINAEDRTVPEAVAAVIPAIAAAVDAIVAAFRRGGRLLYMGAGTSGRLGVLDASECPPTFGVSEGMVVGLIAGGEVALTSAVEGAEDDEALGRADLAAWSVGPDDVVVGIAASGRTPYVLAGLAHAKSVGATTVSLSCNPGSEMAAIADIDIAPVVGPEVLTGSTRLKSGTAEKLVLNMLTTASMIRLGKSYENLMVDLSVSNEKLLARALRTIVQVTGCPLDEARRTLDLAERDVKLAILLVMTGMDADAGRRALAEAGGFLRRAVAAADATTGARPSGADRPGSTQGLRKAMVRNRDSR